MGRAALRTATKVTDKCPECGSRAPKELVEGRRRVNVPLLVAIVILSPFGCFLPLFFIPLCFYSTLEAYCEKCQESFPIR